MTSGEALPLLRGRLEEDQKGDSFTPLPGLSGPLRFLRLSRRVRLRRRLLRAGEEDDEQSDVHESEHRRLRRLERWCLQ